MIFKSIAVINVTWAVTKESLKKFKLERESNPLNDTGGVFHQLSHPSIPLGVWSFFEFVMNP